MRPNHRIALGQRLKASAKARGLKSDAVGEALQVEGGTVRGWWRGYSEPDTDRLRLYARLVGVSVDYLVSGADQPMGPIGSLQEWRLRYADLIRAGVSPLDAIEKITGPVLGPENDYGIPDEALTEEERTVLAQPIRWRVIEAISPGQWEELTADQKDAVLRVVQAMARANRAPPAPPASGTDAPEP